MALHDEVTFYTRSVWFWPPLCALVLLALLIRLSRWNVAEPEGRGSATPIGTIRGMLELTFAFAFVAAASIASPAAIELVNGTPERAKQSVLDLIHGGKAARPGSFARFRSDPEHTDQGAAAYFLEAYGQRTAAVDVTFSSTPRSVSELARELETFADFPTREVTIDFTSPQRAHMLVQAKSGQFCVTRSDRAKRIWLFVPATAQVFALTVAEAAMVLEPTGLLPTQSPVVGYD